MGRAPCCEKKGLKRGKWTVEEDEILVKYIAENGEGSWKSLSKNAGLLRCGKSCRLRWINYLRADLKRGNISKEEEEIIIKLHSKIGNRWSLIAAQLPGRTDNEIKNYWNSSLSRRLHYFQRLAVNNTCIIDSGSIPEGAKRRGGRTSRASMMKNSAFMLKAGSIIKRQSLKQNQMSHSNKDPGIASSSSSLIEKECSSPNFDFNLSKENRNTAAEMEGKIVEEEEEEDSAVKEGDELVKVMAEMEKVLMADLENFEVKLWQDDEREVWPWLWEMSGEDGGLDEESLEII